MKKILKQIPYFIITLLVGVTAVYAGSLTPPGGVANTMYSLTDIYNLAAGTTTTVGSGDIAVGDSATPGSIAPSGKSLTDVYTAISDAIASIDDSTILTGTTIFGVDGTASAGSEFPSQPLKTGQTLCNAFNNNGGDQSRIPCADTEQDGDSLNGASRSYTDNSNGTITDNATGLTWQKCSRGQTGSDCSGGSATTLVFDDGNGDEGIAHQLALKYCNDNTAALPGSGWRLPNIKELLSIVDYGRVSPAINTSYFPNTRTGYYWSSTADQNNLDSIWAVTFGNGRPSPDWMGNDYYLRCVRS